MDWERLRDQIGTQKALATCVCSLLLGRNLESFLVNRDNRTELTPFDCTGAFFISHSVLPVARQICLDTGLRNQQEQQQDDCR